MRNEVPDALWERIAPLLPPTPPRPKGGRPRVDDRLCLNGIVHVLRTGVAWEDLPREFGCGMTCWRRLRLWQRAGVWRRLHELLLADLRAVGGIGLSRACVDSSSLRALKGGEATGPNPTDRGRAGSKHHVVVDARGTPLATTVTGAHRNDVTQLLPLVAAIPPVRGRGPGRPWRRPWVVVADRAYDHQKYRTALNDKKVRCRIARRGVAHGSGLGRWRWVVERTISWLHQFKRLRVRWERTLLMHEGFLKLACCLICWRTLKRFC